MHLIKLAVGIESVNQLSKRQLKRFKEKGRCIHITRSYPRKLELREDFTSIYWVIKGKRICNKTSYFCKLYFY